MANYDIPQYPTKRLRYFNNQFLNDQDFIDDSASQLGHERAFLRSLCVAGVCEGLVVSYPAPGKPPSISAGVAIDKNGCMIAIDQPTDGLANPAGLADGDYFVHISFLEAEDNKATSQGAPDYTRWKQTPVINAAKAAALPDGVVVLGSCTVKGGQFVGSGTTIGRQYSGLRLPGPNQGATATLHNNGAANDLAVLGGSLTIRRDVGYQIGPTLTLLNSAGAPGAGGAIDFNSYDPGTGDPSVRIQSIDVGSFTSDLAFSIKQSGAAANTLVERLRLTSDGLLKFPTNSANKIVISDNGTDRYGIGLNTSNINLFCPTTASFSLRQNSSTGTEVFSVSGSGTVSVAQDVAVTGVVSWGGGGTRTEVRDDAGLQGNAGARSGFFQTSSPKNFPKGATDWWHLLDVRHSNPDNNFALQIAGAFSDQNLWFRKTNNDATTSWRQIVTMDDSSNASISGKLTLGGDVSAAGNMQVAKRLTANGALTFGNTTWDTYEAGSTILTDNANYKAMMIVGSDQGQGHGRWIRMWDDVQVEGTLTVGNSLWLSSGGTQKIQLHYGKNAFGEVFGIETTWGVSAGLYSIGWSISSDAALKTDVVAHEPVIDRVMKLRPVRFTWKADGSQGSGFIAQEVEALFPDLVHEALAGNATGRPMKSIAYDRFGMLAVAAIKELKTDHDARLAALEQRLATLEGKS